MHGRKENARRCSFSVACMEKELLHRMEQAGIDVPTALERTAGNEALYVRLLKKFLDRDYYAQVESALDQEIRN